MPSETTTVLEANDRLIQFGCARKTAVECLIPFARRFDTPPRVVVTPFWEEAGREVGHAETIDRVTEDDFVLFSNNAASNYFVSWIAVGYARGGRASHNVHFAQVGDLVLEMGRTPKTNVSVTSRLLFPFAHTPNVQVSPFWEGQRSGVGHAETVGRVAQRSFDAWSDNHAANYWVSWLAAGTGRADLPPRRSRRHPGLTVSDFPVGDLLFKTLRYRLRSGGVQNLSWGAPEFAAPPTVVVTPFWRGQGRGVGHAETLLRVEPHFLLLAGDNGAENYFVSILAVGPRA